MKINDIIIYNFLIYNGIKKKPEKNGKKYLNIKKRKISIQLI